MTNAGSGFTKVKFFLRKYEGGMTSLCHGMAHGLPQAVCPVWRSKSSHSLAHGLAHDLALSRV